MSGPENNPRDDEPIDRKEYEKWEAQQKGEKMPTFDPRSQFKNIVVGEAQMAASDGQWATHVDRIMYAFDKLSGPPAASEERGLTFGEWFTTRWPRGNAVMGSLLEAWNAALQSVPSSPPHQIAGVTVDAPKGIPGWIKVEPSDAPQDAFEGLKATPSAFAVPSSERVSRLEQDAAAPSDAGQPVTDHLNKANEFFDAWIMGHLGRVSLVQALANLTQAMEQRIRNEYAAKLSPPPRTCQEEQD